MTDLISRADAIEAVEGLTKYMEKLVEGAEKFPEAHTKNYKHDMEQQIVGVAHASQVILELPSADAEQETVPTVVRVTMSDGSQYYLEHERDAIQADAVQGEWEDREVFSETNDDHIVEEWQSARCSVCGKYHTTPYMYYFDNFNYCPNCGAIMKGGDE